MEFGINYSPQAARLLKAGRIKIDRFKTPDWPDMIKEASAYCPVAVHFELRAGNGTLTDIDWKRIENILEQTETPYVNLHMDARIKHYPGLEIDTVDPEDTQRILHNILEDLTVAIGVFGAGRLIVENVPYRGWDDKSLRPAVIPSHIHHILDQTGCGLLLDIAHARISAHHLGMDEREYILQLPVDKLRELHFNGVHRLGNRLQDHLEPLEADWLLLDWVLECISSGDFSCPWMFVFEYGGVGEKFVGRSQNEVIAIQAPRLYQIIKNIQPT